MRTAGYDEYIVAHATLLPVDGAHRYVTDGWMHVRDGVIVARGAGSPPRSAPVFDVHGRLIAPGFVSSHSHLATTVARGRATESPLYDWTREMYAVTRSASPDDIYWATLHGAFDLIRNGVTCAFDFAEPRLPWRPIGASAHVEDLRPLAWSTRQFDAKRDSGIRFLHAIRLDEKVGTDAQIRTRFVDMLAHVVATGDPLAAAAIYGAAQWSDDRRTAIREADFMREYDLINQAHLLETSAQLDRQRERFDWYAQSGALGPRMVFGHLVHATPEIIAAIAAAGSAVSWQPAANGRLGSGIADVPALRAAAIRVGLGLDDQACTDIADPWQNMRIGLYTTRAVTQDAASLTIDEVLRMHTVGAAELMGLSKDLGSLEVGKAADFVVVDPRRPDIGPIHDPVAAYVLSCGTGNIESVHIGGRQVSDRDRLLAPEAARASREIHDRFGAAA